MSGHEAIWIWIDGHQLFWTMGSLVRSFLSSRASEAVRQCVCKKQQAAVEIKRRVRSTKLYRTTTLPAVTEHICPTPSLDCCCGWSCCCWATNESLHTSIQMSLQIASVAQNNTHVLMSWSLIPRCSPTRCLPAQHIGLRSLVGAPKIHEWIINDWKPQETHAQSACYSFRIQGADEERFHCPQRRRREFANKYWNVRRGACEFYRPRTFLSPTHFDSGECRSPPPTNMKLKAHIKSHFLS